MCRIQLIDAIITAIDIAFWSASSDIDIQAIGTVADVSPCDYAYRIWLTYTVFCNTVLIGAANIIRPLAHAEFFIICLIVSKKFRTVFYNVCKRAVEKTVSKLKKTTGTTANVVIVVPVAPAAS